MTASLTTDAAAGRTAMHDALPPFSPLDALVAVMVAVSVSDDKIPTAELLAIETIVNHTPIFASYDIDRIRAVAQTVYTLFEEEDGLDAFFGLVRDTMPARLFETAYALACDVAAADGRLAETELRMLEEIREELEIARLSAAAIELGARVRHITL